MPAVEVLELLKRSGRSLAVAESLTGGLLAAEIVDVPGASAVFRGGIVAYATDLKSTLLGVDPGLLKARGPVDPEVAGQMAAGIRHRMGADVGVSTTGVAGPDPQNGRVPGTVFIAVDVCGRLSRVQALAVPGDRGAVRAATVRAALALLGDVLTGTDADADAGTAEGTGADTGTWEQG
ncbi:CinA family protein [Sanguibacter gelidistatuariae]|nr:nicotinamide-nucleotide amidohydrolase family protein [Sanguibacter gelidistatuariae]